MSSKAQARHAEPISQSRSPSAVALLRPPRVGRTLPGLDAMLHSLPRRRAWSTRPVVRTTLEDLHLLMGLGPAMVDASPTRVLFLSSDAARARLAPYLPPDARHAAAAAPVAALIGYDVEFAEQLAEFLPCASDSAFGSGRREAPRLTALQNGVLQGAYLVVAARALGLEAVAIPDFDAPGAAREFFRRLPVQATFLCLLGYAAETPRLPRPRAA